MKTEEEFQNWIKEQRLENDMSQEDLAELCFFGRRAIQRWERGLNRIPLYGLLAIAEIFDKEIIIVNKE